MNAIDARICAAARRLLQGLDRLEDQGVKLINPNCPACGSPAPHGDLCARHELDALLLLKARGL